MADTERLQWHRSSYCETNACVEVARRNGEVLVRDGKDPEGPGLTYSAEQWISFLVWLRRRRE